MHSLNTMLAATRNFVGPPELTAGGQHLHDQPAGVGHRDDAGHHRGAVARGAGHRRIALRRRRHVRLPRGDGRDLLRRTRSPARPRAGPGRGAWRHRRADHVGVPRRIDARSAHPRPRRARVRDRGAPRLRLVGSSGLAPRAHGESRKRCASATTAHRSAASRCASGRRPIPPSAASAGRTCSSATSTPTTTPTRVRRRLVLHRRPRRAARRAPEDRRPHQGHRDPQRAEHPDQRGRRCCGRAAGRRAVRGLRRRRCGDGRTARDGGAAARRRHARVRRDGRRPGRGRRSPSGRSPRSSSCGTSRCPRPRRARCSATSSRSEARVDPAPSRRCADRYQR